MRIRVRWLSKKTCEVTLIPGWLGKLFGAETRVGRAYRGTYEVAVTDEDGYETDETERRTGYFWETTRRYVGWRVMRALEASPVQRIEEMTVEQLLTDGRDERP